MSVVIPIYERPEAVAAVVATLKGQTMTAWEALFVDDGSGPAVAAAVEPWLGDARIRFLRLEENRGPAAARNAGIDASRAGLVAFLDSDDSWAPEKLERQLARIDAEADGGPVMCVTLTDVVMPGGWHRVRPDAHPRPGQLFGEYLYCEGGYAQASSLVVSRDVVATVRFREELRQYEDHLAYMALAGAGATYLVVEEPLTTRDNQRRPDRLSSRDDLSRGAAFLDAAGPLMSERARLAFGLRILGPLRLRREPHRVVRDGYRALTTGAIDRRALGAVLVNGLTPPRVRDLIMRRAADGGTEGAPDRAGGPVEPARLRVRTGRDYPVSFMIDLGQRNADIVRGPQAPVKRLVPWGDAFGFFPSPQWDVIHTVNAVPLLTRASFVMTFEDYLPRCPEDRRGGQWLNEPLRRRLLSPRCLRILAMSEFGLGMFRRQHAGWRDLEQALAKTEVAYPSVPVRATAPKPAHDTLKLCFVGSDFMHKGGPALVRAHERLRRAGIPVETTVVSSLRWHVDDYVGPPSEAMYLEETRRLTTVDGVVCRGRLANAETLRVMDESDFLVFPTLQDTFGFVTLEALAGGTPVIASATCALPEVVEDGRNGYLLPFDNDETGRWRHLYQASEPHYLDAYRATMESLATSIEERLACAWERRADHEAFSAAALERVASRFDRTRARDRLEAIYDEARRR